MLSQKPKEQIQILIVDDQKDQSFVTKLYCHDLFNKIVTKEKLSLEIKEFVSPDEVIEFCLNSRVHIILLDKDLGEKNGKRITGMDYIKTFHELQPWAQIIILTADDSYTEIAKAIRLGASDYLLKGKKVDYETYRDAVLTEALNRARLELLEFNECAKKTDIYSDFACKSPVMRFFDQKLRAVAEFSWPVLFLGESGLGKGSAARRVNEYRSDLFKKTRPSLCEREYWCP